MRLIYWTLHLDIHTVTGAAIHYFRHTDTSSIGNITAVDKHPVLRIHALYAVLPIILKLTESFVIFEAAGLLDHVFAVFFWGMNTGSKVKKVNILRKVPDLLRVFGLCH